MSTIADIASIAYSSITVVNDTYFLAVNQVNKEGCFVECGVGAGAQIAAMQLALKDAGVRKVIYAFDSYEGIPLAGVYDAEQPGIGKITHDATLPVQDRLTSSGVTVHSVENVQSNLIRLGFPFDNIHFIKGWFQDTLPVTDVPPIALLRLDGDLYESTLIALEYLYPKVIKGGIVIIDDYALPGCRKAVADYFKVIPELIDIEKTKDVHVVMFTKE